MAISAEGSAAPHTRLIEDSNTLAIVTHCIVSIPLSFQGSKSNAAGEKRGKTW